MKLPDGSNRKQSFEVEAEVRDTADEECLRRLEVLEWAVRLDQFDQALLGVNPHLDDPALLVVPPLALENAGRASRG